MRRLIEYFTKKKVTINKPKKELLEPYHPFESFEDIRLKVLKQKLEDNRHYKHFEKYCLRRLSEQIANNYWKTKTAIIHNENLENYVTEFGLEEISDEYIK